MGYNRPKGFQGSYNDLREIEEDQEIELANKKKKQMEMIFYQIAKDALIDVRKKYMEFISRHEPSEYMSIEPEVKNPTNKKMSYIKLFGGDVLNPIVLLEVIYQGFKLLYSFKKSSWKDFQIDKMDISYKNKSIANNIEFIENKPKIDLELLKNFANDKLDKYRISDVL